jgi:hypothetical protein
MRYSPRIDRAELPVQRNRILKGCVVMEILSGVLFGFQKKLGESVEGCFGDPAFGILPAPAGANQPGPGQLLEMMRHGGLADAQPLPQFARAQTGTLLRIAAAPPAATGEAEKNRKPVRMGQGLEGESGFFDAHISIIFDISNYVKARFPVLYPPGIDLSAVFARLNQTASRLRWNLVA